MTSSTHIIKIDFKAIISRTWAERRLFFIAWPVAAVVFSLIILCVPRTYVTSCRLAPEMGGSMDGGTLGSLASSFGLDLGNMQGGDAISPLLYPDLMEDNRFVYELSNIRVKSIDGAIDTTFYAYLRYYAKSPWWSRTMTKVKNLFAKKGTPSTRGTTTFDPYRLNRRDDALNSSIRAKILFDVDKQTGVITITTKAQDALICRTLADSTAAHLQAFITDYRTSKARIDVEHYTQLAREAKEAYEKARVEYASFADANQNIVLSSYQTRMEDLENEMQLRYTTYTTMNTQLEAAKAKVQERTPAFTTIQGATVPVKPTYPRRMVFVLGMLILTTLVLIGWVNRRQLKDLLLQRI